MESLSNSRCDSRGISGYELGATGGAARRLVKTRKPIGVLFWQLLLLRINQEIPEE